MPQDVPAHSKLIFIVYERHYGYNNPPSETDLQAKTYAVWIYQRLKYAGFPVRMSGVDEAIGGGGFSDNSIAVASPMLAVLANEFDSDISYELRAAKEKGKEIYLILLNKVEIRSEYHDCRKFDLSPLHRENGFTELKAALMKYEYPAPKYIRVPDGNTALEEARRRYAEVPDSTDIGIWNHRFFIEYFYTNVFNDIYNKYAKIEALHDLGNLQILSGLVLAAFQDDPQEEVRAQAALELAKFNDWGFASYLSTVAERQYPVQVSVYAKIAYHFANNPNMIETLIDDLRKVYLTSVNVLSASTTEQSAKVRPLPPQSDNNHYVFISYARRDAESYAIDLANELNSRGVSTWIDTNLEPGTPAWTDEIEKAIRSSSLVIVLVSPAIHSSLWVKREIGFAYQFNKTILPITVLKTEFPIQISTTQTLRDNPVYSENRDHVLDLLIATLQQKLS